MTYRTFMILVASFLICIPILVIAYSCLVVSGRASDEEDRLRGINSQNPDSKPNPNEVDFDYEND